MKIAFILALALLLGCSGGGLLLACCGSSPPDGGGGCASYHPEGPPAECCTGTPKVCADAGQSDAAECMGDSLCRTCVFLGPDKGSEWQLQEGAIATCGNEGCASDANCTSSIYSATTCDGASSGQPNGTCTQHAPKAPVPPPAASANKITPSTADAGTLPGSSSSSG